MTTPTTYTITVHNGFEIHRFAVPRGTNLRHALLEAELSPYTRYTRRANCGGRGLCATCGIWLDAPPEPAHWHDQLAQRFGYPRLSCQITVEQDMVVHLIPDKLVWGSRRASDA